MSGFLSPDHANIPLPIPPPAGYQEHQRRPSSPASLAPTVPNSPVVPILDPGQAFNGLPGGQLPTRYAPTRSSVNNAGDGPVIPQNLRAAPQRYSQTPSASSQPGERERQRESTRNQYAPPERERERDRRQRTFSYPTSPTPAGLAYPAPPISRESAGPGSPSQSTLDERRRSAAGMTPRHTPTPGPGSTGRYSVPPEAAAPGGPGKRYSIPGEATSNASSTTTTRYAVPGQTSSQGSQSRGGYGRYDPHLYNDPANFSRDSLDTVTGTNTATNAGRGGRIPGSPTRAYDRLR
ncbi:hypothetical protein BKA82DRAFT_543550 [Pisolithus tinctorius]|uniref:Uncharacterized protein n=1 Tax=Pisolithus tinctorius Marx 270 TaxID=870435 RepID=A0A0C3P9P0_PISTI|nr:hypothetical protein BKA82DRAFT_543550 [Pisolithus tinctorius]KIO04566.1 hypothetical protein M404DRAFT_543550 [Pisolithus tinctorius Marx 270]